MKNYALSPLLMMSFRACHLPSNASEVAFWPSRDIFPPKRHPRIRYCVFPHCALKDNFISLQEIVKTGVILWENARCVFEISTEKPEKTAQLSDSLKEDVRGLVKLNAT